MLRRVLLAAAAVGAMMAGLPGRAEAVVTYTLTNQVYTFTDPNIPLSSRTAPFNLSFSVSDAAVARGTFQVLIRGGGPGDPLFPTITGDGADFVGALIGNDVLTPSRVVGTFSLSATFAGASSISVSRLQLGGNLTDALFSGTSALFSGSFNDERLGCGDQSARNPICNVSGQLVASVPEPMSLALLGTGLLGMAVARRNA